MDHIGIIIKAAERGDAETQYELANIYKYLDLYSNIIGGSRGSGKPSCNLTKAVYWYTKAAEQGHAEAQYELAGIYYSPSLCCNCVSKCVSKDLTKTVYWYAKAGLQGSADAQTALELLR